MTTLLLSDFLCKALAVYFTLKGVPAEAILLEKNPENDFRELVSTSRVYGKNDVFSRARNCRVL